MKSKLVLFALLLFTSLSFSQTVDVTGSVLDSNTGETLVGTSIFIKNSKTGIATDIDGNFKFSNIPVGSTLVFSYLGYVNFEFIVSKSENITVKLKSSTQGLNEVVVLGYSSQKKRDVTGAVSVISSKTIDDLKPVKVEQALQGTVSGVVVTQQSGAPGAGLDIKIRGVATNGSTGPYVIIDGYQGDLSILNPDDIESITVLKDAQAAIYGTLGANGVVVVTTKSGKRNTKTKVTYSG